MYYLDISYILFESVGCAFESRRGRLYVGVYLLITPIYGGFFDLVTLL